MPKPTIVSPFKFRPPPTHIDPVQQLDGGRTRFDPNWLKWFVDIGAVLPGVYRIAHYFVGVPTDDQAVLMHIFDGSVSFPNNMHGSIIGLNALATADTSLEFQVQRRGNWSVQILGHFEFKAGQQFGSFSGLLGIEFQRGDLLKIVARAPADSTAGDYYFNLVGARG